MRFVNKGLLAIGFLVLGDAHAEPVSVNRLMTVKQHMQEVTIPASDGVFAVANESPQDANQWGAVKAHASALIYSGAWLSIHRPKDNGSIWLKASKNMVNAAKNALKAVDLHDADQVAEAGNVLYEACESCHAAYLNKQVSVTIQHTN